MKIEKTVKLLFTNYLLENRDPVYEIGKTFCCYNLCRIISVLAFDKRESQIAISIFYLLFPYKTVIDLNSTSIWKFANVRFNCAMCWYLHIKFVDDS